MCPVCKNEEIELEQKYCQICGEPLEWEEVSTERLSLDEAIIHAKEAAEKKYLEGFLCYANSGNIENNKKNDECIKCAKEHEQLAEWLEELKKYREMKDQHRWIPVEERLPEESLNSVIGWDKYRERCCFVQYYAGSWHLGDESVRIIAWMPLPEPYQGKEG